jgi:hypothetical protein
LEKEHAAMKLTTGNRILIPLGVVIVVIVAVGVFSS